MSQIDPHSTVGQLVVENPGRAVVLERLELDYCCGGGRPLGEACAAQGLAVDDVVRELAAHDAEAPSEGQRDWSSAPLGELADHIVATHHAYLREALPRLSGLTEKTAAAHGERHPELHQVHDVFQGLRAELEQHTAKEEMILFPMCHRLDQGGDRPQFHCGSIANPIRVMEIEHDGAGDAFARLRTLTNGFTVPEDGCNTYRAMVHGLVELEADTHMHIHKENNILFPRSIERESSLAA